LLEYDSCKSHVFLVWTRCPGRVWLCFLRSGYKYRLMGNVIDISINIKPILLLFASTYFSTTSSICVFFLFTSSHRFDELHRFSATFDDPRVPREYLLAVASGRIAVVRTKVLVFSSLSINGSNRLAHFGYRIGY
jgi:hypothetical protein